ncbi:histidine phosphatase family protein [Cryobacterium sp. TMT1-21]|uniref:Histidine phosphatase family protein n=1 Tax=Cryobacterium shii TaxID=1259235 RepID=A0AAQ2C871_9MICO|nr:MULTISPECIES: histidine phosphatase family protein [Cryobacterium]TFC51658.1 histidine phosphatase family protein [Cryobacterium shii]TFC83653.1 histidine phosphatase family protein [Cryobacterium sp. TmT2-59]TFD16012.1 histidine phosphatase family protein [Cryobacterium sp. TMT1-21]TFD27101.1 histidine phosphatase family protein [Cryobacterium sp. TMT2-23]TFD38261.1 histidine phosphatase family protein [Cryobacterium sp. TMT2-10]
MTERTLILLRHAKSDWSGPGSDVDRPLAGRGLHQAPSAGRWLADNVGDLDLAVVSPATRARSTWELASAELDTTPETRIDDRVYAASAGELLAVVRDLPDDVESVVLVGHNPGFEGLVSLLTGEFVPMKTSALAVIGWMGPWSAAGSVSASLRALGRPPRGLSGR